MTRVPSRLLKGLDARDGHRCAWHTTCDTDTLVPHHRSNRGMGGRKSLDRLSNLVWLCSEANGLIESDGSYASDARLRGIKISSHSEPSSVAVHHSVHGIVRLLDDGTVK